MLHKMDSLYQINLRLSVLYFVFITGTTTYNIEPSLSNLIYSLTHNSADDFVLYFYAVSPSPTYGDTLTRQLSHQPYLVFPYPLIPIVDWVSDVDQVPRPIRKLSRRQFDAIITPVCTSYYSIPISTYSNIFLQGINILQANDPRIPKTLRSSVLDAKVVVDVHGSYTFEDLLSYPLTTVSIYIENCNDKSYVKKPAESIHLSPLVLIYNSFVNQLSLLKEFKVQECLVTEHAVDVTQLHRELYWKAEGVQGAFHYIYELPSYATTRPGEHVSKCLNTLPKFMPICSHMIMSMLTLAKYVHNNTVLLYNRKIRTELFEQLISRNNKYLVQTRVGGRRQELESLQITGELLRRLHNKFEKISSIENIYLQYCKRNTMKLSKVQFGVWLGPFNKYTWLFAITLGVIDSVGRSLGCFACLRNVKLKYKEEFMRYYLFVFIWCGMMLRCYYENGLTSLITVPDSIQGYHTLKELFEANYRIVISNGIFQPILLSAIMQKIFGTYFRGTSSLQMFNTTFYIVKAENKRFTLKQLAFGLYAFPVKASYANFEDSILRQSVSTSNMVCFKSPFAFYSTTETFDLQLVNAYWYMTSMGWLENSGLPHHWREQSLFAEGLRSNIPYGMRKPPVVYSIDTVDDIRREKIFALLLILIGLHLASLILLLVETLLVLVTYNLIKVIASRFISESTKIQPHSFDPLCSRQNIFRRPLTLPVH